MEFPTSVLRIVKASAEKYPDDVQKATDDAQKALHKLPEWKSIVAMLARNAIQDLIYDSRHIMNTRIKREMGSYGGPARVVSGSSEAVSRVALSVYSYRIAGTTLGSLLGKELESIAANEQSIAQGHSLNAHLCLRLKALVPSEKSVREAISEKKLSNLFRSVQKEINQKAA